MENEKKKNIKYIELSVDCPVSSILNFTNELSNNSNKAPDLSDETKLVTLRDLEG